MTVVFLLARLPALFLLALLPALFKRAITYLGRFLLILIELVLLIELLIKTSKPQASMLSAWQCRHRRCCYI